jgi:phosphonopyruvate hydrolase
MASTASALREKMVAEAVTHVMSAHNPLSARLAERAGFDGIWASGFELSAAFGMPDASLISMTQHLEMTRAIADAVELPVIADIDTGYGNAINVMHVVRNYEAAGAAAVVIEDKVFPKDTSLLVGGRQELVRVEEFQGKIEASRAARRGDMLVVARVEALIAGQGQAEAKMRGEAYAEAGADAILIHSKQKTPDEIVEFSRNWTADVPLVIVPTAYPQLTEDRIAELGNIKLVIYGNHAIRAAVTGMERIFEQIRRDRGIHNADAEIVPVTHIFELQGVPEMKAREKKYLR